MVNRSSREIEGDLRKLEIELSQSVTRESVEYQRQQEIQKQVEATKRRDKEILTRERIVVGETKQKQLEVAERQWWSDKWRRIGEMLPSRESMPVCHQCGKYLEFRDIPPISDDGSVILRCPNCHYTVAASWPESRFKVAEEISISATR